MTVRTHGAGAVAVHLGDCLDVLRTLADASVDAVVTDPPYEMGFMGRAWDATGIAYSVDLWREALRVLKPGGHLLAFGGTRTAHRVTCAIEDAGFEIRDSINWIYGSGFPKSMDVSKAIDRARDDRPDVNRVTAWLAAERDRAGLTNREIDAAFGFSGMAGHWTASPHLKQAQVPRWEQWQRLRELIGFGDEMDAEVWRLNGRKGQPGEAWQSAPVISVESRYNEPSGIVNVGQGERVAVERVIKEANSDGARDWQGWGTALKPAHEPIVVARKPLVGTVAANVLAYGTGGINVDACRVEYASEADRAQAAVPQPSLGVKGRGAGTYNYRTGEGRNGERFDPGSGRWPANVVLSHSALIDEHGEPVGDACADGCVPGCAVAELDGQSGRSVSRSGVPRAGAKGDGWRMGATGAEYDDSGGASRFFPAFRYQAKAPTGERPKVDGIAHPTVKPLTLMRWLVRLVTPPGGVVLDPFAGSGTTAEACILEGFRSVIAEKDSQYLPLIDARIAKLAPRDGVSSRCNCTHCRPAFAPDAVAPTSAEGGA